MGENNNPFEIRTKLSRSTLGQTHFWSEIQHQYLESKFCNLELQFCDDTNQTIKCHQLILASVSDLVRKSLKEAKLETGDTAFVLIPGASYQDIKGLLDFFYALLAAGETPAGYPVQLAALEALSIDIRKFTEVLLTNDGPQKVEPAEDPLVDDFKGDYEGGADEDDGTERLGLSHSDLDAVAGLLQPIVRLERIKRPLKSQIGPKPKKTKRSAAVKNLLEQKATSEDFKPVQNPAMCQTILDQIRAGQGILDVDVQAEPMRYKKSHFEWSPFSVTSVALVGLCGQNNQQQQYNGVPLAWPLSPGEDPHNQFLHTCQAFKRVFGFSNKDVFYQPVFWSKLGSRRKKFAPAVFKNSQRKKLAKLAPDQLEVIVNRPDLQAMMQRGPNICHSILPGKIQLQLHKTIGLEHLESIIMLFVLDSGEVMGRMCKICNDGNIDNEAFQMTMTMVHVWSDLGMALKSSVGIGHKFRPCLKVKSLLIEEEFGKVMEAVETYDLANELLHKPSQTVIKDFPKVVEEKLCPLCGFKFDGQKTLNQHIRLTHPEHSDLVKPIAKEPSKLELCQVCGKSFLRLANHHYEIHQESRCKYCGFVCNGKRKLFHHITAAHPETCKKHVCNFCGKTYFTKSVLTKHINQHHPKDNSNRYNCDMCHRWYSFKSDLKRHRITMHLKTLDFKCRKEGCKEGFYDVSARYSHEKKMHGMHTVQKRAKMSC